MVNIKTKSLVDILVYDLCLTCCLKVTGRKQLSFDFCYFAELVDEIVGEFWSSVAYHHVRKAVHSKGPPVVSICHLPSSFSFVKDCPRPFGQRIHNHQSPSASSFVQRKFLKVHHQLLLDFFGYWQRVQQPRSFVLGVFGRSAAQAIAYKSVDIFTYV